MMAAQPNFREGDMVQDIFGNWIPYVTPSVSLDAPIGDYVKDNLGNWHINKPYVDPSAGMAKAQGGGANVNPNLISNVKAPPSPNKQYSDAFSVAPVQNTPIVPYVDPNAGMASAQAPPPKPVNYGEVYTGEDYTDSDVIKNFSETGGDWGPGYQGQRKFHNGIEYVFFDGGWEPLTIHDRNDMNVHSGDKDFVSSENYNESHTNYPPASPPPPPYVDPSAGMASAQAPSDPTNMADAYGGLGITPGMNLQPDPNKQYTDAFSAAPIQNTTPPVGANVNPNLASTPVAPSNPNKQYSDAFSNAPVQNVPDTVNTVPKVPVEEGGMGYGWGEGSSPWGEETEIETNIIPDWSSWVAPQYWEKSSEAGEDFSIDENPWDTRRDEYLEGAYGDLEADYLRGKENIKHAFAVRNDLESPAYHQAMADYEDAYQRRKANITSQFAIGAAGADIDLYKGSMDNLYRSAMQSRGFYEQDMDRQDQYYRDEMADMWAWAAAQESDWNRQQTYYDDGMRLLMSYLTGSPMPDYAGTNKGLSDLAKMWSDQGAAAGKSGYDLGVALMEAIFGGD
jgi:hypothetical protein